ncbi:AraC family transcriptional regulator [Maricurvus nonylphenolicus]|uniref:helix-turn-helix domain-containing protein n=1 Tax=Maricurvus nonylphenolicus TaxID=1008307 RepID=UPI0036F3952F
MNTIGPAYALFIYQAMIEKGIASEELLADTQLNQQLLEAGDNIPMDGFLTLLNNADSLSPESHIGILLGKRSNILVLGSAGMAAAIAPNLRQGLHILDSYSRLHVSYLRVAVRSNLQGMSIGIDFMQDVGTTKRFHVETAFMLFQNYLETIAGEAVADAHYFVPYTKPDYASEYEALIHSPITYEHNEAHIQVPRRVLDVASPFYDNPAWIESQKFLANRLKYQTEQEAEPQPYTQHVHALLKAHEPPLPGLSYIAKQLHVSERTLNRRLQQEGTNLRKIKAALTHTWAKQYLQESELTIDAIASVLGYQDSANFRRAFRSREGCSPKYFREQQP